MPASQKRPVRIAAPHQEKLGHEQAERRQADERQDAGGKQRAGPGHHPQQTCDLVDLGRLVPVEDAPGEQKARRLGDGVIHHVQPGGKDAERAEREADADEPHVLDARIGEHALVVALNHQAEGADRHRQQPEANQQVAGERGVDRRIDDRLPSRDGVHRHRQQHAGHHRGNRRRALPSARPAAMCASAPVPLSCRIRRE